MIYPYIPFISNCNNNDMFSVPQKLDSRNIPEQQMRILTTNAIHVLSFSKIRSQIYQAFSTR